MKLLIKLFICLPILGCSGTESPNTIMKDGTIHVKVSPDEARDGFLTEFFEKEIEYIWLKDDMDKDAQIGEAAKIFGYNGYIIVMDWWIGNCIQVFDGEGNFIRKIRSFGDGPEKYMELGDVQVVDDVFYVLSTYPNKMMRFDWDGNFLNEVKIENRSKTIFYDKNDENYFFYTRTMEEGHPYVLVYDRKFNPVKEMLPNYNGLYHGNPGDPFNFFEIDGNLLFAKTYKDTVFQYQREAGFQPYIVFDYGKYGMDHAQYIKLEEELETKEFYRWLNNDALLHFRSLGIHNSRWLMTRARYKDQLFNSILDKKEMHHYLLKWLLKNDIDYSMDIFGPYFSLDEQRVGISYSGKGLCNKAVEKKQTMEESEWEEYSKGLGRKFVEAAFYAKDSENPVLMVLKTK